MRIYLLFSYCFFLSCHSGAQVREAVNADVFEKSITHDQAAVQILDVRTAGEFRTGHIKKALQADWNNTSEFQQRVQALDKQKPVYIYCLSGPRSNEAAKWLTKHGFTKVVELEGGFLQWKKNGKSFEKAEDVAQMTLEQYQQQINEKTYVLVDFGADWCPPCRKMEPDLLQFLASHPEVSLLKIDAGVHTNLMKQLQVDGIPTLLLVKNSAEVWRNTGVVTKDELDKIWSSKK